MSEHTTGEPRARGAELSPIKRALLAVDQMKAKLDAVEHARTEPIAVVGIGCRFPGADGPEAYWRLLRDGVNAVREVPRDRWDVDEYFDPDPSAAGKMYTKWAGFLDRVDMFDPQFFGIAPREAVGMDPQQRLLLEVCWEALEHAGQRPDGLHGSATGVFLGMVACDYATLQTRRNDLTAIDAYSQSGLSFSIASGRVSYVLGLQGPSMTVDTACSSSLVAVHLAVQSLRLGECRMALAAGVHLILLPDNSVCYSRARMLAADGRCKAFDASADGFVEGEGCGVVVLKRLSDAVSDRDRIYAVIRGSAVNQDGPSGGLTVPNGPSQEAVVRDALARGGVAPGRVGLIEAHGTGTSLGDPIEARALGSVFGPGRSGSDLVALGSVKTNIGHLQGAAGIAGLIKLVLSLHHEAIPPHLHFATPSPHIPWDSLPLTVPTTLTSWPRGARPRAGGVSAFGFSGTNAHVVVEEAPPPPSAAAHEADRPLHVLTLSARTETALYALAGRWAGAIGALDDAALADVCFTANTGRAHLPYRAAMSAASRSDVVSQLQVLATGGSSPAIARGLVTSSDRPKVAFLFTGQGAQYAGMGRRLYETHPVFRAALERCDAALRSQLERPLLSVLYPEAAGDRTIDDTLYTQPALFSLEYALAELWRSWGVVPTAVLGHSLGEYVAATIAGVFPVERALTLIAARARLMQALPAGGSMAAVLADEATVASAIAAQGGVVAIAAVNGPRQVVISGAAADVAAVTTRLGRDGIGSDPLVVSHAFHSPLMEPALDAFAEAVRAAQPSPPTLAVVSNLTGQVARHALTDVGYWRRHLREPVRFADGIATLHAMGYRVFVEIGPKPVLCAMGQRCAPDGGTWLPSLRQGRDDWQQILAALRELHVRGAAIDWAEFDRPHARRRVALPTYPFERSRYWVSDEPSRRAASAAATSRHPLLGDAVRTAPGPVVFTREVSAGALPYLGDHRKHGAALFPATAYLEMGLAAAAEVFGPGAHSFDDLMITRPIVLPDTAPVTMQVVATPRGSEAALQLFTREGDEAGAWELHATGTLRRGVAAAPAAEPLDQLRRASTASVDPAEYYAGMAADGHEYGPAFQAIRELWRGADRAVGRLELSPADADEANRYRLHPVLLDAATQMIGAALPVPDESASRDTFLPVTLERLTVYSGGASRGWGEVQVRLADAATRTLAADVRLLDDEGRVVAAIEGMYLKPFSRDALAGATSGVGEWLHEIGWAPTAIDATTASPAPEGTWVVFADGQGTGHGLARQLRADGHQCVVIARGAGDPSADEIAVDATRPDEVRQAYRRAAAGAPVRGVVYLWALDASAVEDGPGALAPDAPGGSAGLLHVVQAVTAEHETERPFLWVITRGAQPIDGTTPTVEQAATLGLARSITAEHPDLRCKCVDLPPSGDPAVDTRLLTAEIVSRDAEEQVAYRGGVRHAARLRQMVERAHVDGPVALDVGTRGLLDTLTLQPMTRRSPGPGEVEVRVIAAGLNFRDVLNALGMYEGPAGPLGSEFVGTVVARGDGVAIDVGSDVMGMAAGAFRSHLCVPADTVATVPAGLRAEEAATLPVVFLTALHGLERLAGLRAGERVLIHAGTGGVGLAAIQVARRLGAEVFATAGSDEKRDYLRRLGLQHVFNSRTLEFGDQIRAATGGAGVDVVLNSLNGDFIAESVGVLARGGRFVEIGKAGIWTSEQMAAARPDVRYFPLYLGDVDPATLQALYGELRDAVAAGVLRPLPFKTYGLADARQAFRFMAQARHIGKLVLTAPAVDAPAIRSDATYLITGAFGGLGAQVARWLVDQGARHLAMVGRQGPATPGAAALISELEAHGASIQAHAADVGDAAAMADVFGAIRDAAPLRGVIHAAGVLDDGVLQQQSLARLARVFGPKVSGAWLLHEHTKDRPLDFFTMFSSMVTVVGAPGQGNYAAANATLDALAHYRRAQGLPALTINWGPWSEAGMSAGVSQQDRQRWQRQGISFISGRQGLAVLGQLLLRGTPPQVAVLPVQWRVLFEQFPPGGVPALYAELAARLASGGPQARASQVDLPTLLREVPAPRVPVVVVRHITELAFKVMGLDDRTVMDPHRPLQEYGLDSLMAVELRNALGGLVGRTLPATLLFKYPTVQALADHVLESVPAAQVAAVPEAEPAPAADVAEIGSMSDAEVKKMLAEELASLSASGWPSDDGRTDA